MPNCGTPIEPVAPGGSLHAEPMPFSLPPVEEEDCDVVVVGGGLAGLRAAIAARERGARVLLLSKTPPSETTSVLAWGTVSGAVGGVTVEDYLAQLESKSQGVGNPALRAVLAKETAHRLDDLPRFGVPVTIGRGHVRADGPFSRPGLSLIEPMVEFARAQGVTVRAGVRTLGLLLSGDAVCGLVIREGTTISQVRAGAVVLCGGGFSGLLPRNDNIGENLGDCLALGLLSGAGLVDIEFITFQPPGIAESGRRMDSIYSRALVNAGRWFSPEGEPVDRSNLDAYYRARAEVVERFDNRYDLKCDLSEVAPRLQDDKQLAAARDEFLPNWPLAELPVTICPLAHYTFGGLAIDEYGSTGVPGLFAAGECTGGIFGAGRPGGGALADCLVFGARAGEAAAELAAGPRPAPDLVVALKSVDVAAAAELRVEAGWAAWNYASLYKHARGLDEAGLWLRKLSDRLAETPVTGPGLPGSTDAAVAVAVAQALVRASALREESRGEHRRLDYPKADPAYASRPIHLGAADVDLHTVTLEL